MNWDDIKALGNAIDIYDIKDILPLIPTGEALELYKKALMYEEQRAARSAGGKKAAENMTEKERHRRAIKAAKARWKDRTK